MTSTPESPSSRIGPYRLLDVIGRGGMGVVYRAEHEESGERVALKTVRVPREELLQSLRREIRALARIRHPGVVRILGEGIHDGLPWYAMELLEGMTLRRALALTDESPTLPPGEEPMATLPLHALAAGPSASGASPPSDVAGCLRTVRRLCGPLAYLHGEGVVHRDLKPENVLVRADGWPVLMDFGLMAHFAAAAGREALELAGPVAGTLAYMAPEQLRGELVDARADLYALGCILFELLAGRPPFDGDPARVLRAHLEEAPPDLLRLRSELPAGVGPLVQKLLAKAPGDRLGCATDLAAALERLGAGDERLPGPRPRAYLYRPRLTGRDDALGGLDEALAAVARGAGSLVLVGGESGVGRTRLLTELTGRAHRLGLLVLAGECAPVAAADGGGERAAGTTLQGLRGPLQAIADRCRDRGAEETARILGRRAAVLSMYEPALGRLPIVHQAPAPHELPGEAARLRLFSYLAETLRALSEIVPVVLLVDDLQSADELTLGFLEFLLRGWQFERMRVLVVATYRREEATAALQRIVESPVARHVKLGRLDEEGVRAMVADMLALPAPPRELVSFLLRHSEGVPFFVAEYLRAAVWEEILTRDADGSWRAAPAADASGGVFDLFPLPTSLRELLARRLTSLDPLGRKVMEAAALLGRPANVPLLGAIAEIADEEALEAASQLVARAVLEEAGPGLLRFVHGKLQQIALEGVSGFRRRRLHQAAAEALERAPDRESSLPLLAYHWEQCGDLPRARSSYLAAARGAASKYAHHEAEELYRSYLRLTDVPDAQSVEARNELGSRVLRTQGRTLEALAEHMQARAHAAALHERSQEGHSLVQIGRALAALGRMEEARRDLEAALGLFGELGDRNAQGQVLVRLFHLDLSQGRWDEARQRNDAILGIARDLGEAQLEAEACNGLGLLHHRRGQLEEARAPYEQALALHRRSGNRLGEGHVLGNLSGLCMERGRMAEAHDLVQAALAIAREVGDRRFEGSLLGNLAELCRERGRLDEAEALFEPALSIARECGDRAWEGIVLGNLALLRHHQGRIEEARALHGRALDVYRGVGDLMGEGVALVNSAYFEMELGRVAEARVLFERALQILAPLGDTRREALALIGLAGLDRLVASDLRVADERLARAESILRAAGDALELARVLCERGHVRLARGEPAWIELDRARQLATDVRVEAESQLGRRIVRLERAIDALDAGRTLFRGELADDIPAPLRDAIGAGGAAAPPA